MRRYNSFMGSNLDLYHSFVQVDIWVEVMQFIVSKSPGDKYEGSLMIKTMPIRTIYMDEDICQG